MSSPKYGAPGLKEADQGLRDIQKKRFIRRRSRPRRMIFQKQVENRMPGVDRSNPNQGHAETITQEASKTLGEALGERPHQGWGVGHAQEKSCKKKGPGSIACGNTPRKARAESICPFGAFRKGWRAIKEDYIGVGAPVMSMKRGSLKSQKKKVGPRRNIEPTSSG